MIEKSNKFTYNKLIRMNWEVAFSPQHTFVQHLYLCKSYRINQLCVIQAYKHYFNNKQFVSVIKTHRILTVLDYCIFGTPYSFIKDFEGGDIIGQVIYPR